MSTLTKICVVLAFVLALISCVVFYQTVSTTANYKKAYESQHQRADLAETGSQNHQMASHHWRALYREKEKDVLKEHPCLVLALKRLPEGAQLDDYTGGRFGPGHEPGENRA